MNEKEIIARYNQILDELLSGGQLPNLEDLPPELRELLSTAQQFSQNDFSSQSNVRRTLRARLSQQSQHPIRRNNLMNGIFNSFKSFAWIGVVVLVIFTFGTVLAFALPRPEPASQTQEVALDPPAQEQPPANTDNGQNTEPENDAPPEEQPPAENPPEQQGDETGPQEPQQTGPIQLQTFGPNLEDFPAGYNPLTGLPVDDPSLLALRPVFISISHFPPAATRPPTGLSFSPMVFELFIGKGQTRFFTLFYGQYPQVEGQDASGVRVEGVRSGRVAYEDINQFYNACLIIGGADPQVGAQLTKCASAYSSDPDNIGSGGLDMTRLKAIAEQSAQALTAAPNMSGNLFDYNPPPNGAPANSLLMFYNTFNQTQWVYDSESGAYLRYADNADGTGEFHLSTDKLTGEPLTRENVIILFAQHHVQNAAGTIIDLDLAYTQGKAYLFRDGQVYEIRWSTLNGEYEQETGRLRPIRFEDLNGNPIALKPGTTWVNLVDLSTSLEDLGGGNWKARFFQPEYTGE